MADASDVEVASAVRMLSRNDLNHEMVVCAARDRIARLSRQVRDLQQQLTAVTARAEQAEAACGEMREALQMVVDHYSMPAEAFGEKYYMRIGPSRPLSPCYMNLVQKALSSNAGKSTADGLRALRALRDATIDAHGKGYSLHAKIEEALAPFLSEDE